MKFVRCSLCCWVQPPEANHGYCAGCDINLNGLETDRMPDKSEITREDFMSQNAFKGRMDWVYENKKQLEDKIQQGLVKILI